MLPDQSPADEFATLAHEIAQDYIGLYGGDAKLLSESLEYVQRTATHILNAIGADNSSAPPA